MSGSHLLTSFLDTAFTQRSAIEALSGKKHLSELHVLTPNDSMPMGCAVYPVSSAAAVFLELTGNVDPDQEIARIKPKMAKAADAVKNQEQTIAALGESVRGEVRDNEDRKLKDLLSEQRLYEESMTRFEELKL